ncbi:hAT transposon superfamily protein [Zea mays]|uniref:HAT transposon superfamily protein n=1 Tax=Zea mays TaxID=4577 RepID=A0A1D6JF90_MAIZE|nr:hAT transposon superfamily protein [Zea mays]
MANLQRGEEPKKLFCPPIPSSSQTPIRTRNPQQKAWRGIGTRRTSRWHYGKAIHHWLSGSSLQRKNKLIAKHTFFSARVYKPELHELAAGGSTERRLDSGVVVAVLRARQAAVL